MRDIRASVEVRALIGAEKLRELHGKAFAQYECWQCGGEARTTEATSVIVVGHRAFPVVMLAHAACADSHIIEVDADMMSAVAEQTAASPQPGHRARGTARRPLSWPRQPAGGPAIAKEADMATGDRPMVRWTAVLRRQPARVVDGRPEDGYTDMFEVICRDCGDDPRLDYLEVSPRLQLVRGPYSLAAGAAVYEQHVDLHQQPNGTADRAGER